MTNNPQTTEQAAPTTDELKARVLAVKATIKNSGSTYTGVAVEALPHLDTVRGGRLITDVWNLRAADLALTEAWEKFAESLRMA
jgi:hypothetical protein